MQYLINIDGFVVRSPLLLLLLATPLKSCTMESEILLQFHSILPKVVYFRMELHPIVQRRPRVAMVLVAWWCHSGSAGDVRGRGGSGISFDTNIVVRCNTKPSCFALHTGSFREHLSLVFVQMKTPRELIYTEFQMKYRKVSVRV